MTNIQHVIKITIIGTNYGLPCIGQDWSPRFSTIFGRLLFTHSLLLWCRNRFRKPDVTTRVQFSTGFCLLVHSARMGSECCVSVCKHISGPDIQSSLNLLCTLHTTAAQSSLAAAICYVKVKVKVAHTWLPSIGFRSWWPYLAVRLQMKRVW